VIGSARSGATLDSRKLLPVPGGPVIDAIARAETVSCIA